MLYLWQKYTAMDNPFILEPYRSKELFCDRETESALLLDYLLNGRNVTLISPRRLGKTGLIYRVFDEVKQRGLLVETYYADISSSSCIEDFVQLLSESVASVLARQNRMIELINALKGIRPVLGYDSVSDTPKLSFTYQSPEDKRLTVKALMSFLENNKRPVILAIDEFQQVREYPGVEMEALLRTYIQPLHNVRFIFCGSKKHMMTDMFTNPLKPFYDSTAGISLAKLDKDIYGRFILSLFAAGGKSISPELVDDIIRWTRDHTFYTQFLCNEVFRISGSVVEEEDIRKAKENTLASNLDRFLECQRLITPGQWKLMKAIAKEGEVRHPTAADFIQKYKLSTGPAILKNLKSLIDKELILADIDGSGVVYCVYNVFLSRYLEAL